MPKNYIGLATTCHDPAIAIIDQHGEVVFAEATERYLQNKRGWNCLPDHPVYIKQLIEQFCDPEADLVLAKSWSNKFRRNSSFINNLLPLVKGFVPPVQYDVTEILVKGQVASQLLAGSNINRVLNVDFGKFTEKTPRKIKITERRYNHHLCHAAYACFSSGFEHATCAIVDAMGEDSSYAFYRYENGLLKPIPGIKQHPVSRLNQSLGIFTGHQSLGMFYSMLSEVCGFDTYNGEEWKLMGLAPYGEFDPETYQWLRPILQVENAYISKGKDFDSIVKKLTEGSRTPHQSAMEFANLAHTGHHIFCEIFSELLTDLYRHNSSENLVLAGGCALNSAWAGKILQETPFKNLYIPSAPADDGNCVGAAQLAYLEDNPHHRPHSHIQSPYLGASITSDAVDKLTIFGDLKSSLPEGKSVHRYAAELLANGKIVGWIQGRAEFGPRALGNRSILADPREQSVKDRLNTRVKFREEFRPFAPSVLHEYGDEYFENYQESPYMDRALQFRGNKRDKVPGVVHIDGTGRLQTVKEEWNRDYYQLIKEFYSITGIPLVLNTSFNVMGKPIVHSVEDCIAVFFTSGLDVLVIGDKVFEK